jgi:hypothetical protein
MRHRLSASKIKVSLAALGSALAIQALGAPPAMAADAPGFDLRAPGVDMTGVWTIEHYVGSGAPIEKRVMHTLDGSPLPWQPWAQKIYDQRIADERNGHTFPGGPTFCLPHGMPQMMTAAGYPIEIFQSAHDFAFVHELQHNWRIIHLDRGHLEPDDITPDYMGDSIGHWEGDTLIVDTIGLSEKTTLDMLGAPHTDKMHTVERIHMLNKDQFEILITVDDPGAFTKPWTERVTYKRVKPGEELMEYICLDGNRNKVVNGMVTIDGQARDNTSAK